MALPKDTSWGTLHDMTDVCDIEPPCSACNWHLTVASIEHDGRMNRRSASSCFGLPPGKFQGWGASPWCFTGSAVAARRGPEVGPDERGMPPAMLERVRGAALRCIAATAADAGARPVMLTLAWDVAEAVAPLLSNAHAAPLREAAAQVGPSRLAKTGPLAVTSTFSMHAIARMQCFKRQACQDCKRSACKPLRAGADVSGPGGFGCGVAAAHATGDGSSTCVSGESTSPPCRRPCPDIQALPQPPAPAARPLGLGTAWQKRRRWAASDGAA